MARTAEGGQLTEQHRTDQLALRAAMLSELVELWGTVDPTDLGGTIGRFATAGAVLLRARRQDSADLAGRYVADFRQVEQPDGEMVEAERPRSLPEQVATSALRGAGLSGIIRARRSGFSPSAAARQGLVQASGSASSLVLAGGRETIIRSADADPASTGRWQRVTSGEPCAFCAMLASRGPVFSSETTANFETHGHCGCFVEPAYEGSELPETSRRLREQWEQAQREHDVRGTANNELNAFRRHLEAAR